MPADAKPGRARLARAGAVTTIAPSTPRHERARLPSWASEAWLRAIASDPGLLRLRLALRATLTVALIAAVMHVVGPAVGVPGVVATLLGGMAAMQGSFAASGRGPRDAALTLLAFPLVALVGSLPAALTAGHPQLQMPGFAVVMVVAVFVRRYGPRLFMYGMFGWFTYFFTAFVGFSLRQLPVLLLVITSATACVVLVGAVLVSDRPGAIRRAARRAFEVRVQALLGIAADVVEGKMPADEAVRRLHAASFRLVESALIVDAHLAELDRDVAVPQRRALLETELACEDLAAAVTRLSDLDARSADPLLGALRALAAGDVEAARARLPQLDAATDASHQEALADASRACNRLVDLASSRPPAAAPAHVEEYQPAVDLMSGNLPTSTPSVVDVVSSSRLGLSLNTRLCIQTAVAASATVVLGELISPKRYYWAVIACFLALTGTFTTGEVIVKGLNRVVGTLAGLAAATLAVRLTGTSDAAIVAVMFGCVFLGLYFFRVSYAVMAFAITTLMGELYSVLHEFTDALLWLRVEETALGAVVAIVVVLVLLPVRTADAREAAERAFLADLDSLLADVRDRLTNAERVSDLMYDARHLDAQLHQIALVARPAAGLTLTRMASRSALRLIGGYSRAANRARALTVAVAAVEPGSLPAVGALVEDLRVRLQDSSRREARLLQPMPSYPEDRVTPVLADLARAVAVLPMQPVSHRRSADDGG